MGFVGIYLLDQKIKFFLKLISIIPFIIMFGGSRLNMVIFTIAVQQIIDEGKQKSILFYALMLYMSIKSVPFIINVSIHADGFY